MKRFLIVVLVISAMLSAAFVDQNAAKKAAENYYKNYAPVSAKGNEVTSVFAHEYEGQVTWYGVNFDQGFVIISADDAVRAILGYSFDGKILDPTKRDGGFAFKEWFGYYDKQINGARKYAYTDAVAQTEWKNISNNIFPKASKSTVIDALVKSKWDQIYPWNDQCPEKDGTYTYVGCVATAASMILRYHEWPPAGVGSNSYSWNGTTLSESFTGAIDYSMMPHVVEIEYGLYPEYWETINMTQAEIDHMAEFNYLVGVSCDMDYGTSDDGGSGAFMPDIVTAYNNNWQCSSSSTNIGTPTDPTYQSSLIRGELDAKRPWQWAGGVHSFILDGYTDDYWYHFNWGWGGWYDGWFQITSLVPDGALAGGGDGDYTSSQIAISVSPDTNTFAAWPTPTGFSGNLANGEDVQLSWNSASGAQSYNVWKATDMAAAVIIANTTATSYNDNDQTTGEYSYYVTAVYTDGESHNTDSYAVTIVPSVSFPVPRSFAVEAVGRTNVDLTWLEPFTGFTNFLNDFEGGVIPSDWFQKTSTNLPPDYVSTIGGSLSDPKPPSRDWWGNDDLDEIRLISATEAPHIVFRGEYACIFATAATTNLWLLSPNYTFNADHFFKFWTRFKYGDGAGGTQHQIFSVVSYAGTFTDQSTPTDMSTIATFDSAIDPTNEWESEWNVSLASLAGQTKHVGIMVEANTNDYYTFTIDDILIGSNSGGVADDPTGIEIYRNGSLATTAAPTATSWSDTNFIDGDNTYYLRAIYPTGESLATKWNTVNIDANPKPDYLTGVLNGSSDVDLAWYMPYGTPSQWSTLIAPENCTTTVDYLDDTDCAKRRAEFTAEAVGLYYPVTIDSIAGGFFEWDDDLWGANNTFIIRLWDGHPYDGSGTLLFESGTLTATPGEVYSIATDQPYVLNGEWNVEVEALDGTTGHPSTLAGPSTGGINCYFFYTLEDSYNYYVSSGDSPLSYCLMAYTTGSDPTDTFKSAWSSTDATYAKKPMIDDSGRLVEAPVTSPKAIDTYNIYREGSLIGTSSTTTYTDLNPAGGDNTYYVTATYTNPVGESAASNSVIVNAGAPTGDPAVPANVVTSISGSDLVVDWDISANATGYDVYSSDDPYGTFTYVTSVGTNQYTVPASAAKLFYYIKAKN